MVKELNHRQGRFVEEYVVDGHAQNAAIRAGYSEKTAHAIGSRLLKHVEIKAAIRAAEQARNERTHVDQGWVIKRLVTIVENGMQTFPVMAKDGTETGLVALLDARSAIAGLEKLGKHLGMFSDRIDHDQFVKEVRELAREAGVDEEAAIAEAEALLSKRL